MKYSNAMTRVLSLFVAGLVLAGSVSAHADDSRHCSLASVAGAYGFTTNGTIPALGPVAATGTFTQDASGNLTGSQTRSLSGAIADETFTGTATVNSDCTGIDTIQVFQDGAPVRTSTLHVVYDDNAREARAIFTSLVLQNGPSLPGILTIEARKIFPKD
jgi:hypothetical protein